MKFIYKNLAIIVVILFTASCEKEFVETTHPGQLTTDKFYKTASDFQSAVSACYRSMKGPLQEQLFFADLMTDNTYSHQYLATSDFALIDKANVSSASSTILNYWQDCYQSIAYCNIVISRIGGSEVPESMQEVFTDEAKFIRAYTYFNLVRVFGGVPKYEEEITDLNSVYDVGRASVDDIYAFIIEDLTDALDIDSKRGGIVNGKVSSNAVRALLGKVYLQNHDFENAKTTLEPMVDGIYLEENFEDLFNADDPFNKEIIFPIIYERSAGLSSFLTGWTLPKFSRDILPNVTDGENGVGAFNIEPYIVAKFSNEDKRRSLIDSVNIDFGIGEIKYYYSKKYLDLNTTAAGLSGSNFILLRNADVLLMYADALNQTGATEAAYQYINRVRTRAGLSDLPADMSKEEMHIALAEERQKEFILEGDRWFDLSYRGFDYLSTTLNAFFPNAFFTKEARIESHQILFPIPGDEVDLKPDLLPQNPGY